MLDDALTECLPELDDRRIVLCAVYPAYDLAWQMEELLQETPDLTKLANCVALLRVRRTTCFTPQHVQVSTVPCFVVYCSVCHISRLTCGYNTSGACVVCIVTSATSNSS